MTDSLQTLLESLNSPIQKKKPHEMKVLQNTLLITLQNKGTRVVSKPDHIHFVQFGHKGSLMLANHEKVFTLEWASRRKRK